MTSKQEVRAKKVEYNNLTKEIAYSIIEYIGWDTLDAQKKDRYNRDIEYYLSVEIDINAFDCCLPDGVTYGDYDTYAGSTKLIKFSTSYGGSYQMSIDGFLTIFKLLFNRLRKKRTV